MEAHEFQDLHGGWFFYAMFFSGVNHCNRVGIVWNSATEFLQSNFLMNYDKNGCFLKWWYPQSPPQNGHFLVGKPMVVG